MQRKILLLVVGLLAIGSAAFAGSASAAHKSPGVIFTLGNQPGGNAVLVYDRSAGGTLTPAGSYPTGGNGTGGGLGSQSSLVLAAHGHRLFAVNAGSNSLTEFKVNGDRLKWVTTVPSGVRPGLFVRSRSGAPPGSLALQPKVHLVSALGPAHTGAVGRIG